MVNIIFRVLVCVVMGHLLQDTSGQNSCQWSGFGGCECNILGACDIAGTPKPGLDNKLTGYAPSGLEQFRYDKYPRSPPNLAYLCEDNTVAILYDCNAKLPLYAATVMDESQLRARYRSASRHFRASGDSRLSEQFQQTNQDYEDALARNVCYESQPGNYFVDVKWLNAHSNRRVPLRQPCTSPFMITSRVHRGHLVAANYGRGVLARIRATFTYTNAVPQFGIFNSGQWNAKEKKLVTWGQNNCLSHNRSPTQNVRMYIVVGTIPSTSPRLRRRKPRFFGESGFSDYQGWSTLSRTYRANSGKKEYRVNVPRYMWTAACCTFQYHDGQGQLINGARSTSFYRSNDPGRSSCILPVTMGNLFPSMSMQGPSIDLFPAAHSECYSNANYVIIN